MRKLDAFRLIWRTALFTAVLCAVINGENLTASLISAGFFNAPVCFLWCVLMCAMLAELIPALKGNAGNSKQFSKNYSAPKCGYDAVKLSAETRKMNRGAFGVLLIWCVLNAILAFLYLTGSIPADGVILTVTVYYVCDAFCMYIWCPLQQIFMRSRCCVDCRIYGWGYFLVFAPLALIPAPFTISLSALSALLLLRWEVVFMLYPERFWHGSNAKLNCAACRHIGCRTKRGASKKAGARSIQS